MEIMRIIAINIRAIRETPFKKLTHNFINMHITSPWARKAELV